MNAKDIKKRLLENKLFKDSFWAICGNGLGNLLMLLAGILVARFLGKDLYGEYGVVKSTMFYIASFATFGLGFTSTKYIANAVKENPTHIKSIVRSSISITLSFSGGIAVLLLIFAPMVASYLEEEGLTFALRSLAVVIIFKAITTTQIGILSGFKVFKRVAYNSLCSGLFMLVLCIPLTYLYGLEGALVSLMLSQMFNALINYYSVKRYTAGFTQQEHIAYNKEMIKFSFPVALQESSFTVSHWAALMLLTKLSTMGDVGIYSACAQWNSIILMVPILLNNVVLSYLSGTIGNAKDHNVMLRRMLLVNFICTLFPFIVVYIIANQVALFYGSSFSEMSVVLRIITFTAVVESCSSVLKSEYIAQDRPWTIFCIRGIRDLLLVAVVYLLLSNKGGQSGASLYAWANVCVSIVFFVCLIIGYRFLIVPRSNK